jgi:hypothetical protein
MVATTRMRPPHRGQASTSLAKLWRMRSAHDHLRGKGAGGGIVTERRAAPGRQRGQTADKPSLSDYALRR